MSKKRTSQLGRQTSDSERIRQLEETVKGLSRALEVHHANERRLLRAQRMALVGDWQMDLRTMEQEWSAPLYEIFDIPPDVPASYEAFKSCLHPADLEETIKRQDQMIALGNPFSSEFRIVRKDGEVRNLRAEFDFEYDVDGTPLRIVGIDQDITKSKEIENALIGAKKDAEAAAKAKTDFLAHMSHELRTPLNAIIGFSSAISAQIFGPLDNSKYLNYVENINASGDHLLQLINDILDLSSIEAGKLALELLPLNLSSMIDPSISFLKPLANARNIDITTSVQDDLPEILADERRVRQILLNLLSNAVKFTPPGGRVKVSLSQDKQGSQIIAVEDTGPGMSDKDIELAMVPFQHSNPRIKVSIEGTGLGLPLTERLLKAHGGDLEIKSTPGKGTTVFASFPA